MVQFLLLTFGGLRIGAIYALAAIGLVVIHKATGVVNFAHGALIMLGAYGTFIGLQLLGLPYPLLYVLVPLAVGTLMALAEHAVLKKVRQADAFTLVIITVFVGIGLTEAVRLVFESEIQSVPAFVSNSPIFIGPVVVTLETLWIILGALAAGTLGVYLFARAPIGRAMRAMSANIRGAQLCGYSVHRVYAHAWLLGGALAGLAGVFAAPRLGVSPELAAATIVPAFVAAIIGGFNSLKGAILGGFILGLLETYTAAYLSASLKNAIVFLILLLVLMFRPEGLFPDSQTRRV